MNTSQVSKRFDFVAYWYFVTRKSHAVTMARKEIFNEIELNGPKLKLLKVVRIIEFWFTDISDNSFDKFYQ